LAAAPWLSFFDRVLGPLVTIFEWSTKSLLRILRLTRASQSAGRGEETQVATVELGLLSSQHRQYVMNLVDQVSVAKIQMQAEAAAASGNVDKATRLLGNAIAGTQRLGNTKATQALVSLQNEMKKTQSLSTRAAKTQLLTAQATLRKTQLLDPESVKDALRE